jgi:hypothetical protein
MRIFPKTLSIEKLSTSYYFPDLNSIGNCDELNYLLFPILSDWLYMVEAFFTG